MKTYILPSLKLTFILILLFAGIYPLIIAGLARLAPGGGNGVTVEAKGKTVGFANVGQNFTADKYFWGRPSAVNYNANGSGGSNKGPFNPEYLKTVQDRIDTFLKHNPTVNKTDIPSEMVTASGSGLDPHISVQGAKIQIARIAKVRKISPEQLATLIDKQTEKPLMSTMGPEVINVLKLNIALDEIK